MTLIFPGKSASETRSSAHGRHFEYNTGMYNFKDVLETLFGCDLSELHKWLGNYESFKRHNDQHTLAHRVFYSNFKERVQPLYNKFITTYIKHIVQMPFTYQIVPTFRVGLPSNRFVGEYHRDSKYMHPDFELNFNLAITNYKYPCCLISETSRDLGDFQPIECDYGQIFSFNHIDCLHGSDINTTNETMVSFDFRIAMQPFYYTSDQKSVNMKSAFRNGDYFSDRIINSDIKALGIPLAC